MNKIKLCFDHQSFESKPTNEDAARISKRIGGSVKELSPAGIRAFALDVSRDGRTFCPATFKGNNRRKDSFEQQQLFTLDFDGGISFSEVKERAENYELPVLFAYDTLSSKEHDKFRVVFVSDVSVTHRGVAEAMQTALHTIFPESDPNCAKDISRMYYGGKNMLHYNESMPTVNVEALFRNMALSLKKRYGETNYKRKLAEFSRATGIALNGRMFPDVSIMENDAEVPGTSVNKNSPNPTNIVRLGDKLSNKCYLVNLGSESTGNLSKKPKPNVHLPYRSGVLNNISSSCRLYREFESCDRVLHHQELFGLATNIIQVESGAARFKNTLKANSYFSDQSEKYKYWEYYLHYIKDYKPQSCTAFCPHGDTCPHGTNLLSTAKVSYHQFERLANFEEHYVSLEEAESDFKKKLERALQAEDTKWHIIKAQTALGKTQSYLEAIHRTDKIVLVAVPTNKLKHEVRERAEDMGIKVVESPSLHEIKNELPDDVWEDIEKLYDSGMSVIPYLKKCIRDGRKCSDLIKSYLKELEDFISADSCAITTHRRLLTLDVSKYDVVIIDEDIIFNSIIRNKTDISVRELKKLKKKFAPNNPLGAKIRNVLKSIKNGEYFTFPKVPYDKDYGDGKPMGVDLPSFCLATGFVFRKSEDCVSFLKPVKFTESTKYIMVSATVDKSICELYFGEKNMSFKECKKAEYTGTLNQYYKKSMSRACIDKDVSVLDRINRHTGSKHTISFMKYGLDDLHFGNTEGCDYLKGEDIDVIGTPHQPEWIYKLFAYSLGFDCDISETISPGTTACHNGYRFRFTTYDDEVLRNIQFYIIESELEQAVGRARLLRCDCTVNLFSNFPLRQAVLKTAEFDVGGDKEAH